MAQDSGPMRAHRHCHFLHQAMRVRSTPLQKGKKNEWNILTLSFPYFIRRDRDGLYILEHDSEELVVFEEVFQLHRDEDWNKIAPLRELVDTLLRSRQAQKVVFSWLQLNSRGKTQHERVANREACVFKLLEISPSAIYFRYCFFPPPPQPHINPIGLPYIIFIQ
mgnify:FL=1